MILLLKPKILFLGWQELDLMICLKVWHCWDAFHLTPVGKTGYLSYHSLPVASDKAGHSPLTSHLNSDSACRTDTPGGFFSPHGYVVLVTEMKVLHFYIMKDNIYFRIILTVIVRVWEYIFVTINHYKKIWNSYLCI